MSHSAIAIGVCILLVGTGSVEAQQLGLPKHPVDFERHVVALFGRMGCNAGTCHGSFQSKGGLRLSLFGHDAEWDHQAITRDSFGRRVDVQNPDESLLLLKATGATPHGGGRRFAKGSWQHRLLRDWIAAGAPRDSERGNAQALIVTPGEHVFKAVGESIPLRVVATFVGGETEDVTHLSEFFVRDESIATITPEGVVTSKRMGDTAVVVRYRKSVQIVRLLVPRAVAADFAYPAIPEVNYVDREVFARLRRLNVVPSELSSDHEFLRRVSIHVVGKLPTPGEVRAFLADKDPDKRTKLIDKLLADPLHGAMWATRLSDITGNNAEVLERPEPDRRSQMWFDWLRKRIERNVPYDEIVRDIMGATTQDGETPESSREQAQAIDKAMKGYKDYPAYAERRTLDLFWRRHDPDVPLQDWAERTATAFLGVRLACAQCHKHPYDQWTQNDYWSFANAFGQVKFGDPSALPPAPDKKKKAAKDSPNAKWEVHLSKEPRSESHPRTGERLPPRLLDGKPLTIEPDRDARLDVFEWMRAPDNPYFARAFVNRVWKHYFGIGLVEPVDDFSKANPPGNEKLLDALAKDFVAGKYDIRQLERTILVSRTYQLSSVVNATNKEDLKNFSHKYVQPIMAEVVVDMIDDATGGNRSRPGTRRALEVGTSQLKSDGRAEALRVFGKPARANNCDCERPTEAFVAQTLFMMSNRHVLGKVVPHYREFSSPRLNELLKDGAKKSDADVYEELTLAALSRLPTKAERESFAAWLKTREVPANWKAAFSGQEPPSSRRAIFSDVAWALLNSTEFLLHH